MDNHLTLVLVQVVVVLVLLVKEDQMLMLEIVTLLLVVMVVQELHRQLLVHPHIMQAVVEALLLDQLAPLLVLLVV